MNVTVAPQQATVLIGSMLVLYCANETVTNDGKSEDDSNPQSEIVWYLDSVPLKNTIGEWRVQLFPDGKLEVTVALFPEYDRLR